MFTIELDEFVSIAGMNVTVEGRDSWILKFKVMSNSPQPGVLDRARSLLGWYVLADAFNDVLNPGITKLRLKLADPGQVHDSCTAGYHACQRRGHIRVRHITQVVYSGYRDEISKACSKSAYAHLRSTH